MVWDWSCFTAGKRTCWFSRRKKIRPLNRTIMLCEHQRIITKQCCDELSVNESGTCGFNFLLNTHICRFKEKNALLNICWTARLWKTWIESLNPNGPSLFSPRPDLFPPLSWNGFSTSPHFLCKIYLLPSRS